MIAPVARVEKLAQAILAGRDVRRDEREIAGVRGRFDDAEIGVVLHVDLAPRERRKMRERRQFFAEIFFERGETFRASLDLDENAGALVADKARQPESARARVNVRTKNDALHDALNFKTQPADRVWGLRQGAVSYLTKPVSDDDLVAAVREALR